jgi:hypothetical protein
MSNRNDYKRVLDIMVHTRNYKGKFEMLQDEFFSELKLIFPSTDEQTMSELLNEMEHLELIQFYYDEHSYESLVLLKPNGRRLLYHSRDMNIDKEIVLEMIDMSEFIVMEKDYGFRSAYVQTLKEIINAFRFECFVASISVCGKIIEIMLYELIKNSSLENELWYDKEKDQLRNDLTLVKLRTIATKIPELEKKVFIPKMIEIKMLSEYRNGSIHFNQKSLCPDESDASVVFITTINILKKYFKHRPSPLSK